MSQAAINIGTLGNSGATQPSRRVGFGILAAVAFAGLYDFLFFGHPAGFTVGVFILALLALLLVRWTHLSRRRESGIVVAAMVGLAAAMVLEPTGLSIALSIAGLGMLAMLGRSAWVSGIGAWLGRWGRFLCGLVIRPARDGWLLLQWVVRHPRALPRVIVGAARWTLPVGFSAVFLLLFAVANPVIGDQARLLGQELVDLLRTLPEWLTAQRIVQWGLVMGGTWGLQRVRPERRARVIAVPPRVGREVLSARMVERCLVAFNLVFGVQSSLDVAYLWAGAKLPAGMTYAAYAHRGAYPLVATALLAGFFVLVTFRAGGAAVRSGWARGMVYAWIGQNVLLMVSTIWRLYMYVGAYGLTYWRISTMVWVGLLGAGFFWIVLRIVQGRSNVWMMRRTFVTMIVVLYACCFVDFPAAIAGFNVRHCAEATGSGAPLDVGYLEELGPGALPALEGVMGKLGWKGRAKATESRGRLVGELQESMSDWRGWTCRRANVWAVEQSEAVER